MLNIPPHLEACRPRGLFSIFHGTSSPVARRCPRASDLVLSAEHAFLLYERPGLHLQSGASAVGGVLRGARRHISAPARAAVVISIHAPRVGRDPFRRPARSRGNKFQSTRPVWGATRDAHRAVERTPISIHAPRVGRDADYIQPPAGAAFQSTRPVWGATRTTGRACRHGQFQSTRPVWGATRQREIQRNQVLFQSTRPVWGATESGNLGLCTTHISIHAPRVGRDYISGRLRALVHKFQSTRPVWGAT